MRLDQLRVKLFADGADKAGMLELSRNPAVKGFTTNPTLMRQAGIRDYEAFAHELLESIPDRPVSFEVFSDEFDEMRRQAVKIAGWGPNVYVKIPITNSRGQSSRELVAELAREGVQVNVTAIFTMQQVTAVLPCLAGGPPCYLSIFAGRIADTGRDATIVLREAIRAAAPYLNIEYIWASTRELYNIVQADQVGCHIVTVPHDLLKKLSMFGRDLNGYSLETVQMFYRDATAAGYTLSEEVAEVAEVAQVR